MPSYSQSKLENKELLEYCVTRFINNLGPAGSEQLRSLRKMHTNKKFSIKDYTLQELLALAYCDEILATIIFTNNHFIKHFRKFQSNEKNIWSSHYTVFNLVNSIDTLKKRYSRLLPILNIIENSLINQKEKIKNKDIAELIKKTVLNEKLNSRVRAQNLDFLLYYRPIDFIRAVNDEHGFAKEELVKPIKKIVLGNRSLNKLYKNSIKHFIDNKRINRQIIELYVSIGSTKNIIKMLNPSISTRVERALGRIFSFGTSNHKTAHEYVSANVLISRIRSDFNTDLANNNLNKNNLGLIETFFEDRVLGKNYWQDDTIEDSNWNDIFYILNLYKEAGHKRATNLLEVAIEKFSKSKKIPLENLAGIINQRFEEAQSRLQPVNDSIEHSIVSEFIPVAPPSGQLFSPNAELVSFAPGVNVALIPTQLDETDHSSSEGRSEITSVKSFDIESDLDSVSVDDFEIKRRNLGRRNGSFSNGMQHAKGPNNLNNAGRHTNPSSPSITTLPSLPQRLSTVPLASNQSAHVNATYNASPLPQVIKTDSPVTPAPQSVSANSSATPANLVVKTDSPESHFQASVSYDDTQQKGASHQRILQKRRGSFDNLGASVEHHNVNNNAGRRTNPASPSIRNLQPLPNASDYKKAAASSLPVVESVPDSANSTLTESSLADAVRDLTSEFIRANIEQIKFELDANPNSRSDNSKASSPVARNSSSNGTQLHTPLHTPLSPARGNIDLSVSDVIALPTQLIDESDVDAGAVVKEDVASHASTPAAASPRRVNIALNNLEDITALPTQLTEELPLSNEVIANRDTASHASTPAAASPRRVNIALNNLEDITALPTQLTEGLPLPNEAIANRDDASHASTPAAASPKRVNFDLNNLVDITALPTQLTEELPLPNEAIANRHDASHALSHVPTPHARNDIDLNNVDIKALSTQLTDEPVGENNVDIEKLTHDEKDLPSTPVSLRENYAGSPRSPLSSPAIAQSAAPLQNEDFDLNFKKKRYPLGFAAIMRNLQSPQLPASPATPPPGSIVVRSPGTQLLLGTVRFQLHKKNAEESETRKWEKNSIRSNLSIQTNIADLPTQLSATPPTIDVALLPTQIPDSPSLETNFRASAPGTPSRNTMVDVAYLATSLSPVFGGADVDVSNLATNLDEIAEVEIIDGAAIAGSPSLGSFSNQIKVK